MTVIQHTITNIKYIILSNRSLAENDPQNLVKKFPIVKEFSQNMTTEAFNNFVNEILDLYE